MNEMLLQYIWNYKVFSSFDFEDEEGNSVEILDFGKWNSNSGADFSLGKVLVNGVTLVGNIEIHVRASDWIFHKHATDGAYQNIILHAVFENDVELPELKNMGIPTLELKNYISRATIQKYTAFLQEQKFIPCEKLITPAKIPFQFAEESLLRKLDEKSADIEKQLKIFRNDYEAVLFHTIAYAFGLKVNALIFKQLAESVDYSVIGKIKQNQTSMEALLFGLAGWLQLPQDAQMAKWKTEFDFLKAKYAISNITVQPKFLRLRPPNFPTIRLSQLAHLYHSYHNIFSATVQAKSLAQLFQVFEEVQASEYWDNKFNFGKESANTGPKKLSRSFIELIIINAVLPVKYTYMKARQEDILDEILQSYSEMESEENSIVKSWRKLGIKIDTALESQAFIHHYTTFCQKKRCLECSVGLQLLK